MIPRCSASGRMSFYYLDRKPTIEEMVSDGVQFIGGEYLERRLRLYSVGTPRVLALIFRYARSFDNT